MRITGTVLLSLGCMAFCFKAKAPDDEFCNQRNTSFQAGEQLTYTVYYSVAGIYIDAGQATFTNTLEKLNNKPVYHITGEGKTKYGKFRAIKFRPLLIKGTIFSGGEKMTVWVSDDENHIPLRVESPIVVGKVKVDMMGNKNLRHPLTSLIKLKGG